MASWGGHTLPGFFFLIYGLYQAIRVSWNRFKKPSPITTTSTSGCCCKRGCNWTLIEGGVKIFCTTVGILIELFYPGAPMGRLHNSDGQFINPENWQHATMYFFFLISGVADFISVFCKNIVPEGIERFFVGLALYVEGYLFYFHLHGRSNIGKKVHMLIVWTVWPCALAFVMEFFLIRRKRAVHILELIHTMLMLGQGFWFWQVAYILYPPHGKPWDPCMDQGHGEHPEDMDCNMDPASMRNDMFITLFYTWWLATALGVTTFIYFTCYKLLKMRRQLREDINGDDVTLYQKSYDTYHQLDEEEQTGMNGKLIMEDDDL